MENKTEMTADEIISKIDDVIGTTKGAISEPTIAELDQFRKSWFYHNWSERYRKLYSFSPLALRGLIGIPNTTFEEWLWWFHEWAEAFLDDYNAFKKMVYDALAMIEKHLELIDKEIKDINDHLHKIDEEINNINNQIDQIHKDIDNINKEINDIKNEIAKSGDALKKILENLKNSGSWTQDGDTIYEGHFNPGRNLATGNINAFGGTPDGSSFIRTNSGQTENDITAGIN